MSGHQEARRAMPITQSTPASVAAHPDLTVRCGRTAAAHRLDAELVAGAARHINQALACAGPDATQRSRFIASAVSMLQALRGSLDLAGGDTMAAHLDDLCEYMSGQLCKARSEGATAPLDEVSDLLNEVRMAWFC
jgi:flagellar protein FliS